MYYNFEEMPTLAMLQKFANQRPQLDFHNYGDLKSYRQEVREITKDLHDFRELLNFAVNRVTDLESKLKEYLLKNSGRLTLNEKGNLEYITGQYFPTEYRPACNRVLKSIIWREYANQKNEDGTPKYSTGGEIRKQIRRYVTRRTAKNYFN